MSRLGGFSGQDSLDSPHFQPFFHCYRAFPHFIGFSTFAPVLHRTCTIPAPCPGLHANLLSNEAVAASIPGGRPASGGLCRPSAPGNVKGGTRKELYGIIKPA